MSVFHCVRLARACRLLEKVLFLVVRYVVFARLVYFKICFASILS